MKIFPVVCLSGSMRFFTEMLELATQLTSDGYIVLMPFVAIKSEEQLTSEEKQMLDEMHKQKILMSTRLYVVMVNRYVGASTKEEIRYAISLGIQVEYHNYEKEL